MYHPLKRKEKYFIIFTSNNRGKEWCLARWESIFLMPTDSKTCHLVISIVIVNIRAYVCRRTLSLSLFFFHEHFGENNFLPYINRVKENRLIAIAGTIDIIDNNMAVLSKSESMHVPEICLVIVLT